MHNLATYIDHTTFVRASPKGAYAGSKVYTHAKRTLRLGCEPLLGGDG